jgi:hypothetical protein
MPRAVYTTFVTDLSGDRFIAATVTAVNHFTHPSRLATVSRRYAERIGKSRNGERLPHPLTPAFLPSNARNTTDRLTAEKISRIFVVWLTCLFYAVTRTDGMKMQSIKTNARDQTSTLLPYINTRSSDSCRTERLFDLASDNQRQYGKKMMDSSRSQLQRCFVVSTAVKSTREKQRRQFRRLFPTTTI